MLKRLLFIFTCLFFFSTSSYAGDSGPFRLVFLDISQEPYQDGTKLMLELRKMEELPADQKEYCFVCTKTDHIEKLYIYSVPVGITIEDVKNTVDGDKAARQRIHAILSKFEDESGVGVDGIIAYKHEEGKVTVYSIDWHNRGKINSVSRPVKNRLLHSSLDKLVEAAAEKLQRVV